MTVEEIARLVDEVLAELARAEAKFPPFHSGHEGLAVVEEEFEEFKREVFHGPSDRQREECIQVAAMCLRYLKDISDGQQLVNAVQPRFA
jgi:hypothetical protein